ncbi:hypothetical protein [Phaeodactylibacter luteus]|nr:hypothetical protein [Phaeodactylibacter luteus]
MLIQEAMRNEQQRKLQQQQFLAEIENDMKPKTIRYEFSDQSHIAGTEHFRNAFAEIDQMLKGEIPMSLKRAVFLTENAYLDNRIQYDWFEYDISSDVEVANSLIEQAGYDKGNPTAKKWALQQLMSDTIYFRDEKGAVTYTHLPYQYDFEDPWGKKDWTKQFVMKLTSSKKGQCHSMPLLYLILAEDLGVEAWLSYSPSHSYIKLKDGKGNLLNYETTNGYYTTDVWVQSSGYIKAEALRSRIYMDTMSRKEVVAATLADLAKGYAIKYGFDQFVLDCLDKALEHNPNNVYALQLRSDYQTYLFFYVLEQLGRPPVEELPNYPKANELFFKVHEIYGRLDALGFEQMPEEVYPKWLQSFETEREKQPVQIIRP